MRIRRVGKIPPGSVCSFELCDRPQESRGLCSGHASQDRAGVELHELKKSLAGVICRFEPCGRSARAKGLCAAHRRQELAGKPLTELAIRKGDGFINSDGYRVLCRPGHPNARGRRGIILEHRFVMAEHLGRPLLPEENVHHKYGDRADNRLENLELWNTSQPAGQRAEDKLEWARHIIELYGEEFRRA